MILIQNSYGKNKQNLFKRLWMNVKAIWVQGDMAKINAVRKWKLRRWEISEAEGRGRGLVSLVQEKQ